MGTEERINKLIQVVVDVLNLHVRKHQRVASLPISHFSTFVQLA